MSKIFEVFGFPLGSGHPSAKEHREAALCPFMEAPCDGGGNRYLSALKLENHNKLAKLFPGIDLVQAGVCSLLVGDTPWIVCPRRLLALNSANNGNLQQNIHDDLFSYGGLVEGNNYSVWSEVKIKMSISSGDGEGKLFDYTFDYVISGRCQKSMEEISGITGKSERVCERVARENGFTLARRDGSLWVDDFPSDPLVIVEIMTSSTSGGNKDKRTQIGMAFEDALLHGDQHEAPGINYRQVWARMVSQLIVKSQVGMAWGGKTIWVLQDVLAQYISRSTGLNLQNYVSNVSDEVNILAFGYGHDSQADETSGTVPLAESEFFAGPITQDTDNEDSGGFVDIIKIGAIPPKERLWKALFQKAPCGNIAR